VLGVPANSSRKLRVRGAFLRGPGEMSTLTIGGSQLDASWFLLLGAILFIIGATGVLVRRNPLVILICIELMLNAANLTLVVFSRQLQNIEGQLFALMSMTVAAAEAVVGLAILVDIFHVRDVEDVDELSELKG
jgi:NADH-quinone oxidoreductase subunit K